MHVTLGPTFVPTHLIVVDQNSYLAALDKRLAAAGTRREKPAREFLDVNGITRQVLVAVTLLGRSAWSYRGKLTFDHSDPDIPYNSPVFYEHPAEEVGALLRSQAPSDWYVRIGARQLRAMCEKLDRYYRHGSWRVDRLSVALGYLWSGLTSRHPELAFVALCTALEAIASTSQNEITHILAERCAVLAHSRGSDRVAMYREIKRLYKLRSGLVHGRLTLSKISIEQKRPLAVMAKQSLVPSSDVFKLLGVTIQVLNSVLARPPLLEILGAGRSEHTVSDAVDDYFLNLLLRGGA